MKITIGSDHRGYDLKEKIKKQFADITWIDVGTDSPERVDYPVFAKKVADNVAQKTADVGILICGSGVGMSISANRVPGIYAALCWSEAVAVAAKQDDNANVLVLPSNFVSVQEAVSIVQAWRKAEFRGGEYQNRLDLID